MKNKTDITPDIKADTSARRDRGESTTLMEPLLIGEGSRHRTALTDLALELAQRTAGFRRSLPESLLTSLAGLVRAMNCYYSNLIEGHDTHPVDIERALKNDYSKDARKRDLQLEAKAHITVQEWIDGGGLKGRALTGDGIREIHRRLCELLPEDLRWVEDPESKERAKVVPGELRRKGVMVGRHVAVSPGAIPRFLARFEEVYSHLNRTDAILGAAAAHHRLAWIHPFLDGNGRLGRLLITLFLVERSILPAPLLYLSAFFEATRSDYYDRLIGISERAEWGAWLEYFLTGVARQAEDALSRAARINGLLDKWRMAAGSPSKARGLVDLLAENPYWTVKRAAQRLGVAYTTAERAVERLESASILARIGDAKRDRIYCARAILEILEEPANLKPMENP